MLTSSENLVSFGQIVVGPPGSGKTTFCHGMAQYLKALGRDTAIVNLDPANHGERLPYVPDVDIEELVSLEGVMKTLGLGPNGSIIYSLEYLEKNIDWLVEKMKLLKGKYILFDFPGQVELFTHYTCIQCIIQKLVKENFRLAAVHLVDAYHCSDASRFISVVLVSLMSMMQLELPQINVLSKVDLIERYGPLAFNLDFFTECLDMNRILAYIDNPVVQSQLADGELIDVTDEDEIYSVQEEHAPVSKLKSKFARLNQEICDIVESFGLVAFSTLDIQDAESVGRVLSKIDKANGYVMQMIADDKQVDERANSVNLMFRSAFSGNEVEYEHIASVQEKYMFQNNQNGT